MGQEILCKKHIKVSEAMIEQHRNLEKRHEFVTIIYEALTAIM